MAYDAGHCEVQNESAAVTIQQVGNTLEATSGFSSYQWYYINPPANAVVLDSVSVITPTGDGIISHVDNIDAVNPSPYLPGNSIDGTNRWCLTISRNSNCGWLGYDCATLKIKYNF